MAQNPCPACGAPIESTERACPYCGAAIVAVVASSSALPGNRPEYGLSNGDSIDAADAEVFRDVREQLGMGKKSEAVRLYREITGATLKEAREAVSDMELGRPVMVPKAALAGASVAVAGFASSAEMMDAVKAELRKGNKVQAVRVYREYFQVGLKESKDAVDAIETELKFQPGPIRDDEPPAFARPDERLAPSGPVVSPNPLDESKKPAWRNWAIGCGLALVLFCCFCLVLPLILFALSGAQAAGY